MDTLEIALAKGLVEQFLEAVTNREPTRFLCNLGIQYIIGKLLSLIPLESLRRALYSKFLNNFFLVFVYFFICFISSVWNSHFFQNNNDILQIMAILLAALSIRTKTNISCSSFKYLITASCFNTLFLFDI